MRADPSEIRSLEQAELQRGEMGVGVDTLAVHFFDDVFVKTFSIKRGMLIGQHSHTYDHGHLVAAGKIRVFGDGKLLGDFGAGDLIHLQAGVKHALLALEDAVGACIHNTHGGYEPSVSDEYEFPQ